MKLYEIEPAIAEILERAVDQETGEINEAAFDEINALHLEKEAKAEYIALAIKNDLATAAEINTQADIHKAEAKRLSERAAVFENSARRWKEYLAFALNRQKFETAKVQVTFRTTKSAEVDPEAINDLPEQYLRFKAPEPKKEDIRKALLRGEELPGCRLKETTSVMIK